MATLDLNYDELPLVNGELDLSSDDLSCRLFLASLLDHAGAEGVEQVRFRPSDGEKCLAVTIGRQEYDMIPLPVEARVEYFRFIQKLVLGKLAYLFLTRLSGKPFTRDNCGPIAVDVVGRRSKWIVQCTHELIRFVRAD
jgi:hypothetical protein